MLSIRRRFQGASLLDFLLLGVFLVLAYVFLVRRGYMGQVDDVMHKRASESPSTSAGTGTGTGAGSEAEEIILNQPGSAKADSLSKKWSEDSSQPLIDVRINQIADTRPKYCSSNSYKTTGKVSIIIDFFDYSFFDLKVTLSSILRHDSAPGLIEEIVVVDDGSTLEYIVQDSQKYIAKIKQCRLKRLQNHRGITRARVAGAAEAKGDILVFLDTSVIVNQGWLEPLVSLLNAEKSTIAVPHLDSINDPVTYDYRRTDDRLVGSMSWSLSIRMAMSNTETKDGKIKTPILRGNALALNRAYYERLKGYDGEFAAPGGENMELSIRTWLCGGAIYTVVCSRVGVLNINDPIKVTNPTTIRRIADLWAKDEKNSIFKASSESGEEISQQESDSLKARRKELNGLDCKRMSWFMKEVAGDIAVPSRRAKHFGLLKMSTGSCVRVADDKRLELVACLAEHVSKPPAQMLFELDVDGYLLVGGRCLTTKSSAYVVPEPCRRGDAQQLWSYTKKSLVNDWSAFCLTHVTDPDKIKGGKRQIAMAQECMKSSESRFREFEFLTL